MPDNSCSSPTTTALPETDSQSLSIQRQRQLLDSVVIQVLSNSGEKDKDIRNVLPFIKRTLQQFHLYSCYEERDIFLEAYARARKRIESGEVIRKIPSWLKTTSLNIIRETSKSKHQQRKLVSCLTDRGEMIDLRSLAIPEYAIDANIKKLTQAVKQISPADWQILKLRIVEGLSWQEIGDHLVRSGQEIANNRKLEQKLRKRGERAIKRLRKKYTSF